MRPTVGDGSYLDGQLQAPPPTGLNENGCSFCCNDPQINERSPCGSTTSPATAARSPSRPAATRGFDTKLAAYPGGGPTGDTPASACNDDASCTPLGVESRMTFPVNAGATYTIRFGGYSTAHGNATMLISSTGSTCGSADFNCDGDIGTDADIASFFACLSGNCPPAPCCSSRYDFNGDGDIGTDADISAFFRVLGGGSC